MQRTRPSNTFLVTLAAMVCSVLAGCGSGAKSGGGSSTPPVVSVSFGGKVLAGSKPVAGATVQMYAASSAGYGASALGLLSAAVTTDASGAFTIPGSSYTCASASTQLLIVAKGGNPSLGAGVTNSSLALMTAWGSCGDLAATTTVTLNEATTVAAAWSLAPFLKSSTEFGASATNATGLANAVQSAKQLIDVATGSAPATRPSTIATEQAKLYSLANLLATCTQSSGGSPCSALFAVAPGASTPQNTVDAAINIVKHPARNVGSIFTLGAASTSFAGLSAAPNDWTMTVSSKPSTLTMPSGISIDSTGRVWTSNYPGGLVALSPAGLPVFDSIVSAPGIGSVLGVAIDSNDNVWVGSTSNNGVYRFSRDGANTSGASGFTASVSRPVALSADAAGSMWIANNGNSSAVKLSATGTAGASATVLFANAITTDSTGGAWAAGSDRLVAHISSSGSASPAISCCQGPGGVALDRNNILWVADYNAKAVVRVDANTNAVAGQTTLAGGLYYPQGIAVDGAGDVWVTNYLGNSITMLAGAQGAQVGTALSPATGFGVDAAINLPYAVAVDSAGTVWVTSSGDGRVVRFLGIATPVKTPLTGPAQLP